MHTTQSTIINLHLYLIQKTKVISYCHKEACELNIENTDYYTVLETHLYELNFDNLN